MENKIKKLTQLMASKSELLKNLNTSIPNLFRLAEHLVVNGVTALPCKVGDTVYTNCAMRGWYYRDKDRPYSAKVVFMGLNNSEEMGGGFINVVYEKNDNMMQFRFSDIGKTVFFTKDEAEAALPNYRKETENGC